MTKHRSARSPLENASSLQTGDSFRTVESRVQTEIKIQGSHFISILLPVHDDEEFMAHLRDVKSQYHDATHHCWAYRLGVTGTATRFSDDGEPSGTAGRRILSELDTKQVTEASCIVVRYFGGTKLGVGGLARAYSSAAIAAIDAAKLVTKYEWKTIELTVDADSIRSVHHFAAAHEARILSQDFHSNFIFTLHVRASKLDSFTYALSHATQNRVAVRGIGNSIFSS